MGAVDLKRAQAAQDRLGDAVGANPEVNGIGIARADGGYVLKVNLRTASARASLPSASIRPRRRSERGGAIARQRDRAFV